MKKKLLLACCLFTTLVYLPSASAITFSLNTPFDPTGPPVQPPLLAAAFEKVAGGVQVKLSADGLQDNSYVSKWYFNVFNNNETFVSKQEGLKTDPRLQFSLFSADKLTAGTDSTNNTQGKGFDLLLVFPDQVSSKPTFTDVFGPQDSATLLFSSPPDITPDWFNELNAAGAFYVAANILKFGEAGENWIASGPVTPPKPGPNPVTEPGTMLLFGFGLIGLAFSGGRNLLK